MMTITKKNDLEWAAVSKPVPQSYKMITGFIQSGLINDNKQEATTEETVEVMEFTDATGGDKVDLGMNPNYLMSSSAINAELGDFLARPVLLHTQSWTEGTALDPATHTFLPWEKLLDATAIQKKIDNYYLMRANLHLKLVINASPFYYGAGMMIYSPVTHLDPGVVGASGSTAYNVGYSQRPNIKFYPQNSQGGELVCPFFWHLEWLDITNRVLVQRMGRVRLSSFGNLLNANSVAGTDCTIQIFGWLEGVQLAGPTNNAALQAGDVQDEYAEGPLSKPASAIARASGQLSELPVAGPFFTATSFAAGKFAAIAKLFGYTDTPVIEDVHAFKSNPIPQLASTDIGTPFEKLSLDCKSGLSVDPKVNNVDSQDELLIKNFCGRESFLFDLTWTAADAADHVVGSWYVRPDVKRSVSGGANELLLYRSPVGHAACAFQYWRGTLTYRIKVLCSQYHRGRILVTWDPTTTTASAAMTQTYNKIVDITECTDFTISVPWVQPYAYGFVDLNPIVEGWSGTSSLAPVDYQDNGALCIKVFTKQTSPVATADIKILVFVKAEEDFELAGPTDISTQYSPYDIQSTDVTEYTESDDKSYQLGGFTTVTDNNINLVYHGESIKSLRTLYRRSMLYANMAWTYTYTAADHLYMLNSMMSRRPRYPGYDTNGPDTAIGLNSVASEDYNWVNWTPMTWFDQCFVGVRGSINWHFNPITNDPIQYVSATRQTTNDNTLSKAGYYSTNAPISATTDAAKALMADGSLLNSGFTGTTATNQRVQSTLSANVPMYSMHKFQEASPVYRTLGRTSTDTDHDILYFSAATRSNGDGDQGTFMTQAFVSAGPDYTPVFFLNVPTMHYYTTQPLPP